MQPLFWLETLTGWLITTLALSLGAPFWFDTLNKFMVVRSTVKPKRRARQRAARIRKRRHLIGIIQRSLRLISAAYRRFGCGLVVSCALKILPIAQHSRPAWDDSGSGPDNAVLI